MFLIIIFKFLKIFIDYGQGHDYIRFNIYMKGMEKKVGETLFQMTNPKDIFKMLRFFILGYYYVIFHPKMQRIN